jgi:hypothetical protein
MSEKQSPLVLKTFKLLQESPHQGQVIAAQTDISEAYISRMRRHPDAIGGLSVGRWQRLHEYLSGKRINV